MVSHNIPYGLCDITYDGVRMPLMGSDAVFNAIPKYIPLYGGYMNTTQGYILEEYQVSFTVSFSSQSYETLKLHFQQLQDHKHGMYDNPTKVNMQGRKLVVHPKAAKNSKEFDLCIWEAYLDPENGFDRIFDKNADSFRVKFIGKPVKQSKDRDIVHSYFFIGDHEKVGGYL